MIASNRDDEDDDDNDEGAALGNEGSVTKPSRPMASIKVRGQLDNVLGCDLWALIRLFPGS